MVIVIVIVNFPPYINTSGDRMVQRDAAVMEYENVKALGDKSSAVAEVLPRLLPGAQFTKNLTTYRKFIVRHVVRCS